MIDRFRKKPVVIEAFQWQGDFDALDAWLNALGYSEDGDDGKENGPAGMHEDHNSAGETLLLIPTLEGEMTAKPGDWVIRGVKGEFYPCKPDIFAATYEPEAALRAMTDASTPAIWRRLKTLTAGWREAAYAYRRGDDGQVNEERADAYENCADEVDTALRACASPDDRREEQDVSAILQSVLQMFGLPFNAAWFDEHGDWDFGKLREHGLDARLAETRAALRACADALAPDDCTPREEALSNLVWWMLGERDELPPMPERVPGAPRRNYWWRRELRARFEAIYEKYPATGKVRADALAPPEPREQILLTALKRVTADMDRAGGDGYGMPECPWCKCQYDGEIQHLPECELVLARYVIADIESGMAAPQRADALDAPSDKEKL